MIPARKAIDEHEQMLWKTANCYYLSRVNSLSTLAHYTLLEELKIFSPPVVVVVVVVEEQHVVATSNGTVVIVIATNLSLPEEVVF